LKINREIKFKLNKIYKNLSININNINSKTEKSIYKKIFFINIDYSLFLIMPWDIILYISLSDKILIENIIISKYFIPHKHPKEFIFGISPEKVNLLPLIKELNKNEKLIFILIIPGQKMEIMK